MSRISWYLPRYITNTEMYKAEEILTALGFDFDSGYLIEENRRDWDFDDGNDVILKIRAKEEYARGHAIATVMDEIEHWSKEDLVSLVETIGKIKALRDETNG